MIPNETIDVLIPTYNPAPEHLISALQSLLQQSYPHWKALIHDDCSKNDVAAIVEPFLSDSRIIYTKANQRLGIGKNWNACFTQTSNPIVAYLFQDDIWSPTYLESGLRALQQNSTAGFVSLEHAYKTEGEVANMSLYEELRTCKKESITPGLHNGTTFLRSWIDRGLHPNLIGEPSFVMIRRSSMEKVGLFLEDMPQFLDSEYWTRLLTITDWVYLDSEDYGNFRIHPSAASAMNQQAGYGLFDRLRCFEHLIPLLSPADRIVAIHARNRAIKSMIEKFFTRIRTKKKTMAKGSGFLLQFCIRHPFLMISETLKYLCTPKKKV